MKNINWKDLHPITLEKKYDIKNWFNNVKYYNESTEQERYMRYASLYLDFVEAGSNVFYIEDKLAELLNKTDIQGIHRDMLKVPFNSFFVLFAIGFESTDGSLFDGVYVNKTLTENTNEPFFKFTLTRKGQTDYHYTFGFAITENEDVLDAVVRFKKSVPAIYSNLVSGYINLIINTLLYISSQKADMQKQLPADVPTGFVDRLKTAKTKRKKEVAMQTITNAGYTHINLVGASFAKSHAVNEATGSVSTHWRRGHWRNQPFGKDEKKVIWIMPVIVNKDKGEPAKGHIYSA